VFALHYHRIEVDIPPGVMLPGDIDVALAAREGVTVSLPEGVDVFRALCKLWTIFVPVASTAHLGR
jgi:hypothetical protein